MVNIKIIEAMNDFIKKISSMSAIEFEKQLSYFIETLMLGHILLSDKKTAIWKRQNENVKYKAEFKKLHFEHEEEFMGSLSEHDFIQRHKKLHQNIVSDFNNLIIKIPKLKIHEIELELAHFI